MKTWFIALLVLPACTPDAGERTAASDSSIVVREVDLFQVVQIPLVADGAVVEPASREAPPIADRAAVISVMVDVLPDWAPQVVDVHVDIRHPDGETSHTASREVFTASVPGDRSTGLRVEVGADAMTSGAAFAVRLADADGTDLTRVPTSGFAPLGVVPTGRLAVHLVPFRIDGFVPDTSQTVIQGFEDALYAVYPVTDVVITVGEVNTEFDGRPLDMGAVLVRLGEIQEQVDDAPQDTYYYGLVSGAETREGFCDECPTGTSEAGLGYRAAFSVGAAFGDARSEDTLLHEMGHMHGLLHAPCGGPTDVDPQFPDPDADIVDEGYDVRTDTFVPRDHKDLMAYCSPRWVGGYHYGKMVEWVQFAQSWSSGRSARASEPGAPRLPPHTCFDPHAVDPQ